MNQKLLNFSEALDVLKQGQKVARQSWNKDKDSFILVINGNGISKTINDYYGDFHQEPLPVKDTLYAQIDGKRLMSWLPNQEDLFANDWFEL